MSKTIPREVVELYKNESVMEIDLKNPPTFYIKLNHPGNAFNVIQFSLQLTFKALETSSRFYKWKCYYFQQTFLVFTIGFAGPVLIVYPQIYVRSTTGPPRNFKIL